MMRGDGWRTLRMGSEASIGLGIFCALATIGLRYALTPWLGGEERVSSIFPALLLATFFGGLRGGATCLALSLVGDWYLFLGAPRSFALDPHEGASLLTILISGLLVVAGMVAIRRLLSDLQEANAVEQVLTRELRHRVKNNLAVVEALVAQSAYDKPELDVFLDRFRGRMTSLSAAQVLLSASDVESATVGAVVATTLQPFTTGDRITWGGEDFDLSPQQTVALALCLHELATNAIKHGALSTPAGQVRLDWTREAEGVGRIDWTERGGPPAAEPTRAGSGLRLLRRGVDGAASTELTFAPQGVAWRAGVRAAPAISR